MLYGSIVYSLGISHPNFDSYDAEYNEDFTKCKTTVYRKKGKPVVYEFSKEDAKNEGILEGMVWKKHLKKMLWRRATRVAFEIAFPDAYAGISTTEEERIDDLQSKTSKTSQTVRDIEMQEIEIEPESVANNNENVFIEAEMKAEQNIKNQLNEVLC